MKEHANMEQVWQVTARTGEHEVVRASLG